MDLEMFTVNLIAYLMNSAMQKAGLAMQWQTDTSHEKINDFIFHTECRIYKKAQTIENLRSKVTSRF